MIVGCFFEGDTDDEVALKQHDVYHRALRIILETCNQHARFARAVLSDTNHPEWGTVEEFDHRTIQDAHDLLAAAWRFEHDMRQPELPFKPKNSLVTAEVLWLDWLRQETARWSTAPRIVRSVQIILTNQNKAIGYTAESQLCLDILAKFADVPWQRGLRETHEANLDRETIRSQAEDACTGTRHEP